MNLIKLFNFKFMKQMLKKAKGQLIIFLLLVPIFTFLSLLVIYSGNTGGVLDYTSISIINFIGMYVIPVILSINFLRLSIFATQNVSGEHCGIKRTQSLKLLSFITFVKPWTVTLSSSSAELPRSPAPWSWIIRAGCSLISSEM